MDAYEKIIPSFIFSVIFLKQLYYWFFIDDPMIYYITYINLKYFDNTYKITKT